MIQAILMSVVAMFNGIQWPVGWYFFREPAMAGLWVGLIYGNPEQGVLIGATISISYLGWISTGGANASDMYWAGLLGTFVTMQAGMDISTAAAFAIPIGLLGNYAHIAYMTLASFWPEKMDKYAKLGKWRQLRAVQLLGGPLIVIFVRALPVFIISYFGADYIKLLIDNIPAWAMSGLSATGKILPALGMSMLMKFMLKKELIPFLVIGFAFAAYTGMNDLLFYALIGSCIAYIMTRLGYNSLKSSS